MNERYFYIKTAQHASAPKEMAPFSRRQVLLLVTGEGLVSTMSGSRNCTDYCFLSFLSTPAVSELFVTRKRLLRAE